MTGGGEWDPDGAGEPAAESSGLRRRKAPEHVRVTRRQDPSATNESLDSELGGFEGADLGRDRVAREAPEPQLSEPTFGFPPAIAPPGRGELVHHHREDRGLGRSGQAVVQEELYDEDLPAGAERVPHPLQQDAILLLVEVMDYGCHD